MNVTKQQRWPYFWVLLNMHSRQQWDQETAQRDKPTQFHLSLAELFPLIQTFHIHKWEEPNHLLYLVVEGVNEDGS